MKEPVILFQDQAQAAQYLREWQSRLSLDDWIITVHLLHNGPILAPDWGSSSNWRAIHVADIRIPMPEPDQLNSFPERYCQELILVHELMHIRLPGYRVDPSTQEGHYYEAEQHATLELIAKALIKAKYGLPHHWFENT